MERGHGGGDQKSCNRHHQVGNRRFLASPSTTTMLSTGLGWNGALRAGLGWFGIRPGREHRAMGRIKQIIVIRKAPVGFTQTLELFRFSLGEVGTREDDLPVTVTIQIIEGSDLGQSHLCLESASEIVVVGEDSRVRFGAHPTPLFGIRIAIVEPQAVRFLHDSLEQGLKVVGILKGILDATEPASVRLGIPSTGKTFLSWWHSWHLRSGYS